MVRTTRFYGYVLSILAIGVSLSVSGCTTGQQGNPSAVRTPGVREPANSSADVAEVVRAAYDKHSQTVSLYVQPHSADRTPGTRVRGEDMIDPGQTDGVINCALARYPNQNVQQVAVYSGLDKTKPLMTVPVSSVLSNVSGTPGPMPGAAGSAMAAGGAGGISLPPPGTRMDPSIRPVARLYDSVAAKEHAVLDVARSKLGTPYIWGHNEDRGQYGFDCSNFTAYVYHHALGYRFTTVSKGQARYVGVSVARSGMRPGDLLIFENGAHVGIYSGNDQMIEEGGGLGKVGYLSVGPNSYWGKHLTAVKRMF